MMYEVWKWTQEEIDQYNEDAGDESAFEENMQRDQYHGLVEYGTLVKKTENKAEAEKAASDAFDGGYSMFSGEVSIWDPDGHFWYN